MINLFNKTNDFIKMMNLLNERYDVIRHDAFANKKWKGVISEKTKAKTCFADEDLSSWTGLGRS